MNDETYEILTIEPIHANPHCVSAIRSAALHFLVPMLVFCALGKLRECICHRLPVAWFHGRDIDSNVYYQFHKR